jgi:uncharacterized protein (TIRG00374 family)
LDQKRVEEKKEGQGLIRIFKDRLWFILGGGIFLLLLIQIGLRETFSALRSVDISFLLMSVGLIIIGQQFIPFTKWVIMCRRTKMDLKIKEVLFLSSNVLVGGIITPARTGEFVTALFVKEMKGKVSSIVLFNRVIESSITLLIAIFVFGVLLRNFLPSESWIFIGAALGIILFLLYGFSTKERFGLFIFSKGKKLLIFLKGIKFFGRILNLEERIVREVGHFYQSMRSLFSWRTVLILIFLTCIIWTIMAFANWFLFLSVGIRVSFKIVIAVMVLSAIGSFISPTPGGIGLGDIPVVYFLFLNGYHENVGAYLLLGRLAVYVIAFGWYFLWAGVYHKSTLMKADLF